MVRVIFLGARTRRRLRAGAGRMLVSADDGGVDRDVPVDLICLVGSGLGLPEQKRPRSVRG